MNDITQRFTVNLEKFIFVRDGIHRMHKMHKAGCINHAQKCLEQRKHLDYLKMEYQ